jgi:hypothetical protein
MAHRGYAEAQQTNFLRETCFIVYFFTMSEKTEKLPRVKAQGHLAPAKWPVPPPAHPLWAQVLEFVQVSQHLYPNEKLVRINFLP